MVGSCGFGIPVESLHRELGDRTGGQEPDKRLSRAKGNGAGVGEREKGTSSRRDDVEEVWRGCRVISRI